VLYLFSLGGEKKLIVCPVLVFFSKGMNWQLCWFAQVYQEVENCCNALSERLENQPYFFGNRWASWRFVIACISYVESYVLLALSAGT